MSNAAARGANPAHVISCARHILRKEEQAAAQPILVVALSRNGPCNRRLPHSRHTTEPEERLCVRPIHPRCDLLKGVDAGVGETQGIAFAASGTQGCANGQCEDSK